MAKVVDLYRSLNESDQWWFPKVAAMLLLVDFHRLPSCYEKKIEHKYRLMAAQWGLTAADLVPSDGQKLQARGPELGLVMPPPPVTSGPLRSPTG